MLDVTQLSLPHVLSQKSFGYTDEDIHVKVGRRPHAPEILPLKEKKKLKLMRIWQVMDECIHTGVSSQEKTLPGRLGVRRRAPMLYRRLMRGCVGSRISLSRESQLTQIRFYPGVAMPAHLQSISSGSPPAAIGSIGISDTSSSSNTSSNSSKASRTPASQRAPLVVGSFDHAMLPMPPVCIAICRGTTTADLSLIVVGRHLSAKRSSLRWTFYLVTRSQ